MGLFSQKPRIDLPVKPCLPPKMAVLVEGIGEVEIPYSHQKRIWYLSRHNQSAYLSERLDEDTIARIQVVHHSTCIMAADIECIDQGGFR